MTKTAKQIAQYRAISAAKKPANDQAPVAKKGTLKLADFVATVTFPEVKIADDANGNPYYAFKGATVTSADGAETVRTVMAFESYELVKQVVLAGQELVVTLAHAGSTMKIVGVLVEGEMKMVERSLPKAA